MNTIESLLHQDEGWPRGLEPLEMDPLRERDALQEAQVLDVRLDAVRSAVGLLFELRVALQLRRPNTGVLVVPNVRALSWDAEARSTARTAWNVVGSTPQTRERSFGLTLGTSPNARLSLQGGSAAFFAGNVPNLDRIPDYFEDSESVVRAGIAGWHSQFTPDSGLLREPLKVR
jgi:hypothetical protein